MRKYNCVCCKSVCYISWFEWLLKFIRPTIFHWRLARDGGYLCPQHSQLWNRVFAKYPSDYD